MLKVTVELWPGGDPRARREIAAMSIGSLGVKGMDGEARYVAMLSDDGHGSVPRAATVSHRREAGPWELVRRILDDATPDALAALPERHRHVLAEAIYERPSPDHASV